MIKLNNISKVYGSSATAFQALNSISTNINEGEAIAILGKSGSGKTTLLDILGTLTRPTKGQYCLWNSEVSSFSDFKLASLRSRSFGFIFQSFNLLVDKSVFANVALPFKYLKNKKRVKERIKQALEDVQMSDKQSRKVKELSGGEQQRVAIARAISSKPGVILADEPTGNLDTQTGTSIISILFQLWKQGKTLIVVTHDISLAKQFPRIIFLEDGMIKFDGPKESFFNMNTKG